MKLTTLFAAFLTAILLSLSFVNAEDLTCAYFFYGDGCQHCAKVEPLINNLEIQSDFPVEIRRFEIYNNRSNMLLLNQYFDAYEIPNAKRGIPAFLVGNKYLIGDSAIRDALEKTMEENKGAACPNLEAQNAQGISGSKPPTEKLDSLSMLAVVGAALVDSINPCAIAVLLILMSALLAAGDKKKAIKAGFAFTVSIYIAYFLFGLGLFSAIQVSGLSYWFYRIIGILAIIIGLANIKDFIWYGGGGFVMEIPRSWRPKLKEMLGKVTSPIGAFLMGFIVCLFELPCTGGPYIVILGLLADKMTMWASIPILLLYNFVFVLPLIIITLLIYSGFANVEKATKWKDNNLRILHLIAGTIMLVLGIMITFGFV
ncbi:MAG: cytochrome c biogenesis protein CcdA [Candidatus Woesearchaeota archaeon]